MKQLAGEYRAWIVGMAGEAGDNLQQMQLDGNLVIVMGGEEKGMRRLTRDHCDALASLPMMGSVESLNVSVATGVALYEVVRQRHGH
jgi:23S rRNA (guanosine2251-2'-O)-methyltransferase